MKKISIAALMLLATAGVGNAANAINLDNEPRTIIVTEGSTRTELALAAGESVDFCPNGCFVTLPNGDVAPLTGAETIEISGGVARIK